MSRIGFGFIECGTTTIEPQYGNPKPRIFRLEDDKALINRLGFNNKGIDNFLSNFKKGKQENIIAGINIGPNKDSDNFIKDYITLFEKTYSDGDYITINLSSPNTEGLREIQKIESLNTLTSELKIIKDSKSYKKNIFLKIDPDSSERDYDDIINIAYKNNIDGLIISNTSIERPSNLTSRFCSESGGLSGKPLKNKSNEVLRRIAAKTQGEISLIGVGGISNAKDVYQKIKLGASAVQLYTALTFEGSKLIENIKRDLVMFLKQDNFKNIEQAVRSEIKD
jgi:dihydroorotate dehydrogenase